MGTHTCGVMDTLESRSLFSNQLECRSKMFRLPTTRLEFQLLVLSNCGISSPNKLVSFSYTSTNLVSCNQRWNGRLMQLWPGCHSGFHDTIISQCMICCFIWQVIICSRDGGVYSFGLVSPNMKTKLNFSYQIYMF